MPADPPAPRALPRPLAGNPLAAVVAAVVDAVGPMADAKRVRRESAIDPRSGVVRADPDRIRKIVWNHMTNAVRATPDLTEPCEFAPPPDGPRAV